MKCCINLDRMSLSVIVLYLELFLVLFQKQKNDAGSTCLDFTIKKSSNAPPLLSDTPVSCAEIYSYSTGMCLPFKTLSHGYPCNCVPLGTGWRGSVAKQGVGKVQGVSSPRSHRCQIWNNALITTELRVPTSTRPLQVSSQGLATPVILLISLQRDYLHSANKIKHIRSLLHLPRPYTWLISMRSIYFQPSSDEVLFCF